MSKIEELQRIANHLKLLAERDVLDVRVTLKDLFDNREIFLIHGRGFERVQMDIHHEMLYQEKLVRVEIEKLKDKKNERKTV